MLSVLITDTNNNKVRGWKQSFADNGYVCDIHFGDGFKKGCIVFSQCIRLCTLSMSRFLSLNHTSVKWFKNKITY